MITADNLENKTIKAYLKHFKIKMVKDEEGLIWLWKNKIALITDLKNEKEVLIYLMGISACYDNKTLFKN